MQWKQGCILLKQSYLGILCIVILALSSCLTPIDDTFVLQVKDETGPTIIILSPDDGSSYAATVVVEGIVLDLSSNSGDIAA